MNTKRALGECILFSGLTDGDLDKIASIAVERQYEAGSSVFATGEDAREIYLVLEGRLAVQMTMPQSGMQAGHRITVDVVTRNEIAGWSAILEPYKFTFTATCLQRTVALAIDGEKLRQLMREDDRIGHTVMRGLVKVLAAALNDTRQVLISERLLPAPAHYS
jgi:CRP-like cAMP-binding protein